MTLHRINRLTNHSGLLINFPVCPCVRYSICSPLCIYLTQPSYVWRKSNNKENNTVKTVHKRRKTSINTGTQNEYIAPKQAPKQIKEPISKTETKTEHRRSPRMPRATAKYWGSIKAELRNPNQDE